MANVIIDGIGREVAEGTPLLELAKERKAQYSDDIVLAQVNGKLQELHKKIHKDCTLHFITTGQVNGMRTYERSLLLLMNKAIYDLISLEDIEKVLVKFSVSRGYYVEVRGKVSVDEAFLAQVKERMQAMVEQDLPIEKINVHVDDAIEFFHHVKMYDKERLFRYRRSSRVNLYRIGQFMDYHYGYMVPSTGYLTCFDLEQYEQGFVLRLPSMTNTKELAAFKPQPKLFRVLQESSDWSEAMDVDTVGEINDMIAGGHIQDLVLIAEARQEKQIADIAAQIVAQPDKKFVMIAGPSSSGKTSFSHRLSIQLQACGLTPHPIAVDNYFVDREFTPKDEDGNYDFESLMAVDMKKFNRDMMQLLAGKRVELPYYNFKQGKQEYKGDFLQMGPQDILVIEGIHCLNDAMSYDIPAENKFKIYISALTQTNIDEHNRIPTTDGRLIRRMIRDARTRGASARDTIARWPSVRRGEENNIFPYQESADVMFNSALVYEFSVMKSYAEQLLFSISKDVPEYSEAKRLLKFFDYFLGVDSSAVPQNSLMKEFIGGSCFNV